jgi:hypothetical protein
MRLMSRIALVLAASLVAAPALSAQTSFVVGAGLAMPLGNFGDSFDMGYNATVGLGLHAPMLPVSVRIEGMYNAFNAKSPGTGTFKIMGATANGILSSVTMLPMMYAIGGLGLYHSDFGGFTSNKMGVNVGAGLKIPLTGFGAHIEARYHLVFTDNSSTSFIPVTFGVTF